jgi:phage shock protein A
LAWYILEVNEVPKNNDPKSEHELSQAQFKADTGLDLKQVEARGVPDVSQTIYEITRPAEFRKLVRLREKALHAEASALGHATDAERQKWQGVVAGKDAKIAKTGKKSGMRSA